MKHRIQTRAFTLIELMVVVSIISILVLIALPNFTEAQTRSKVATTKNNLRVVSMKFEMLKVDFNKYPLAGRWRWTLLWWIPDWVEGDTRYDKFDVAYKTLFGPHQDPFEWEWLKRHHVQDLKWMGVNPELKHIFNGFQAFQPKSMTKAIEYGGCLWEGMNVENWKKLDQLAGEWVLYSCGPDLISETPYWIYSPVDGYDESEQLNYNEKRLFIDYDPTNGTVSYGNIFRTQRNSAGLGADPYFYNYDEETPEPPSEQ